MVESDPGMLSKADALYGRAFPDSERIPLPLIHGSTRSSLFRYRCLRDEDGFVGLAYTVETSDILYIVYLAIDESRRSGGFGSRALQLLMSESGKRTFLNIEPLDPDAPNYGQRVRRRDFYVRNGFREHGLLEAPDGNVFMVMTANGRFTDDDIRMVYDVCLGMFPN